ncbi:hypothetical protein ABBQ38_008147 [Trebouxia sp. C0009 RCD-2024]
MRAPPVGAFPHKLATCRPQVFDNLCMLLTACLFSVRWVAFLPRDGNFRKHLLGNIVFTLLAYVRVPYCSITYSDVYKRHLDDEKKHAPHSFATDCWFAPAKRNTDVWF